MYALAFFQMFMVIVPFFKSKGLSLAEIFYLQAIFAAVIVLFEAPSGYFADVFGRRTALIIGSIAHGVGFLMLNITDDFYTLAIFEIILGLAMSMMSGADLALLYDTKPALTKSADGQGGSIAHLGFLKSSAEGLGALTGGVLALWSFDLMVLVQSVVAWVCLILALQIIEPPNARHDSARKIASMKEICRHLL